MNNPLRKKKMNRLIKILLNSVSLVAVLVINYLSNTTLVSQQSVGEMSNRFQTVITPAGYAFAIWGLIYLSLIFFAGYQWHLWIRKKNTDVIDCIGYYFVIANLANALWVIAWVNGLIGVSLLLILILLGSLATIVKRLNMEKWNAPFPVIFFIWWPIAIYFGWIILATVLNIKVFAVSRGYDDLLLSATVWGVLLITVSTAIYLSLVYARNLRESAIVGVWGLLAIVLRQAEANPVIAVTSLISSAVLLIYVAFHALKARGKTG